MNHSRNAFTRVELAVVVITFAICMTLLLPSVHEPRGRYRRHQCSTQLKNLSLAAIQHENAKGHLPSWVTDFGTFGADGELVDPSNPNADVASLSKHSQNRHLGDLVTAMA